MSHYRMIVAGDVEKLMAPYCEDYEHPGAVREFNDMTEELDKDIHGWMVDEDDISLKYRKLWAEAKTFEEQQEVIRTWGGYRWNNEVHPPCYGYWHNPQAKWDWYVIGGRYSNRLLRMDGTKCDQARKFELVPDRKDLYDDKLLDHEEVMWMAEQFGYHPETYVTWGEAFHKQNNSDLWHSQAFLPEFKSWYAERIQYPLVGPDDLEQYLLMRKEDYAELACLQSQFGYGYLDHTGWYAQGEMGWWGANHKGENEQPMTELDFYRKLTELYTALPGDTLITSVDCHI